MTDKSFGDHLNRNVVKNPLLSTAVTGLSIEDLTHNAVLLPVSLSQEAITRPEQQNRPQVGALQYTEHAVSTCPAGDANSNLYSAQYPATAPSNTTHPQNTLNTQQLLERPVSTVSKASGKSDDDFDVNEYFARLHGTRYVSAPLNSALKEDKNANLEATEENLEEINLNEPEKRVDSQQSLTADIAQNFSQLPSVLPQVASAVFSSFSSMLQTRKSRETTPDVSSGYQDVQFERPNEPKEVLPPPKDPPKEPLGLPPNIGTSNYRLPSKKKYAQIPGLMSGDTVQSPYQPFQSLPPTNQNMPPYFVPSAFSNEQIESDQKAKEDIQNTNLTQGQTVQSNVPVYFTPSQTENIAELQDSTKPIENVSQEINVPNVASQNIPDLKTSIEYDVSKYAAHSRFPAPPSQFYAEQGTGQSTILPPPPMFDYPPRSDSQTVAGKSILPPSVARKQTKRQQPPQIPSYTDNILIPTAVESPDPSNLSQKMETFMQQQPPSIPQSSCAFDSQNSSPQISSSSSQFTKNITSVGLTDPSQTSVLTMPIFAAQNWPKCTETASVPSMFPSRIPAPDMTRATEITVSTDSSSIQHSTIAPPPLFATTNIVATTLMPSSNNQPTVTTSQFPPIIAQVSSQLKTSNFMPPALTSTTPISQSSVTMFTPQAVNVPPQISTPASINQASLTKEAHGTLPPPPTFFTPSANSAEIKEFPPVNQQSALTPEPPKSVLEPPKASGNVNYRMTKKRPQYYAGPIEGVGAISNYMKPVIAPVNTDYFQGTLFTPPQGDTNVDQAAQNFGAYAEQVPFDISRSVETPYSNVAAQPQAKNYNTAFDMSRPTTEIYNEPKQESSGFGLLGSLKSTLGSLDINKIQNTVTTFFDPTYNDTKKDTSNLQEYSPYSQTQYGQFGSTQSSNFEVFVPSVEQATPAYGYNYQMPYKSPEYDYNQAPPQYHESQTSQSYYENPQNVGNYFSDADKYRYQAAVGPNNPGSSENIEIAQADTRRDSVKSQEEINASRQPDIEIQQSYSAFPPYSKPVSQSILSPGLLQTSQSYTTIKSPFGAADVKESEILDSTKTSDANDFYNRPLTNVTQITPPKDMTAEIQHPRENVALGIESITKSSFDDQQSQLIEAKNSAPIKPPTACCGSSQSDKIVIQRSVSQNSSGESSLFEKPLQMVHHEINLVASVVQPKSENINPGLQAAASFFNNPEDESVVQKDFGLIKNTGSVFQSAIKPEDRLDGNVQNVMTNFQTDPADFFSSLNPGDAKIQSIFSSAFDFNKSQGHQENSEVITSWPEETRPLDMSSAPLFGLSTMLANKTKELHDLESEIKNMTIQEPANEPSFLESRKSEEVDSKDVVSELDICETCREVDKLEEWVRDETDDLTTQLIENITSPILLSNAVEVPLTENITPEEDGREDFDTSQCEEISHITEETIEAIQVQAATDLLDDDKKVRDYEWSSMEEITYPVKIREERDYTFEQPTGLEQHNYSIPVSASSIGFFGNDPLPKTISEKLKTEFEIFENVTKILPRQMSTPSAPPVEDDIKSEALDVHSIEQDASKDFPLFEEFVIEPEDEKSKNEEDEYKNADTFSSRVDKYKNINVGEPLSTSPNFNLMTSTSPSISMPSYFDTGNYAADTHYRNSLSSPTSNFTFGSSNQVSVPPGFEEQFRRKLSAQDVFPSKIDEPFIPDTSTQTRFIYSPTFSTAQNIDICVTSASRISTIQNQIPVNVTLPDFKSMFGNKMDLPQENTPITSLAKQSVISPVLQAPIKEGSFINSDLQVSAQKELDSDSGFGEKKQEVMAALSIFETPKLDKVLHQPHLPDPINFFASSSDTAQKSDSQDPGSYRLASYFSMPAKSDHSKSFFELSQSENHYRQEPESNSTKLNSPDDIFNPISSQFTTNIKQTIPHDQYVANLNLMHDLTSIQQPELNPEQIVRHVNYFTIEYDNEKYVKEFTKSLPDLQQKQTSTDENINLEDVSEVLSDNENFMAAFNKCKHCCELSVGYASKLDSAYYDRAQNFKVKKCMDGNSDKKKDSILEEKNTNLEPNTVMAVSLDNTSIKEESNEGVTVINESRYSSEYTPVRHHWFYRVDVDGKSTWRGFSVADSRALEEAYMSPDLNDNTVVATDGGRFDVNVKGRLRVAVYWTDNPTLVRRCSWFYKGTTDARYVPYTEAVADKLEEEYRHGMTTGEWHRRLVLPNNEMVVMHGPAVMVHFLQSQTSDAFSTPPMFTFGKRVYRNPPKIGVVKDQTYKIDHLIMLVHGAGEYRHQKEKIQSTMRPRVVRRGTDESEIEEMEPSKIDHLLLMCHGVGSACDMRFRNVEEVVDDFRSTSLQLIQSHYKEAYDSGKIGRVEVLPISWHATLHSGEMGVDRRLARITLDSIPKLRTFTNDTVLDVLFYTSPVFCQTILNTVCAELNRIYKLFRQRNPDFTGGVSLGGHSLGSVILYDLLCHQTPESAKASTAGKKNYVTGVAGTGQPSVRYPALDFTPTALYALGSPIAIFECIRGVDYLGPQFSLPTCKHFFNIFHPYDPIAYRIEPLVNPALRDYKPYLIPHHKGRKRMHLELKDTMARVGADLKQKLIESFKSTWSSVWKSPPPAATSLEKVVEEEFEKEPMAESSKEEQAHEEEVSSDMLGALNCGRRVDYVLQEAPFEMINEYLFAMSSHVCYWESEDTMLLMLREIYSGLGVNPDNTVPQPTLTVARATRPAEETFVMESTVTTDFPSTSKGPS